jgi:hypothetical protein
MSKASKSEFAAAEKYFQDNGGIIEVEKTLEDGTTVKEKQLTDEAALTYI